MGRVRRANGCRGRRRSEHQRDEEHKARPKGCIGKASALSTPATIVAEAAPATRAVPRDTCRRSGARSGDVGVEPCRALIVPLSRPASVPRIAGEPGLDWRREHHQHYTTTHRRLSCCGTFTGNARRPILGSPPQHIVRHDVQAGFAAIGIDSTIPRPVASRTDKTRRQAERLRRRRLVQRQRTMAVGIDDSTPSLPWPCSRLVAEERVTRRLPALAPDSSARFVYEGDERWRGKSFVRLSRPTYQQHASFADLRRAQRRVVGQPGDNRHRRATSTVVELVRPGCRLPPKVTDGFAPQKLIATAG